ncbi:MAG: hypothetical protein KME06_11575 [Kastovskya adunca ATA6-11-RM4]|jgi:hypothetical protein|nr:hypothetical protein [Kastovskya adunca ATA6-11-RM4]
MKGKRLEVTVSPYHLITGLRPESLTSPHLPIPLSSLLPEANALVSTFSPTQDSGLRTQDSGLRTHRLKIELFYGE